MKNHILIENNRLKLVEHREFAVDADTVCTKANLNEKDAIGELLASIADGSTWRSAHLSAIGRHSETIHFHQCRRVALGAAVGETRFILLGISICRRTTDLDRLKIVCSQRLNEFLNDED